MAVEIKTTCMPTNKTPFENEAMFTCREKSLQITSLCFYNLMTCDFYDYFYLQSTNFH